jgi:uncharacterized damage-inducible protein DinB
VQESLDELRSALQGMTETDLHARPGGVAANSIAILVTHTMHATRMWLSIATGALLPERDRQGEFQVAAGTPQELQSFVDDFAAQCLDLLNSQGTIDWSAARETGGRGGDAPETVSAAYALMHAVEHLRGHVDQVSLVRDLLRP